MTDDNLPQDDAAREAAKIAARKAYDKAYWVKNREKRHTQQRAHYEANRERVKAEAKAWRAANKDYAMARDRAYHHANREKKNAERHARYITDAPRRQTAEWKAMACERSKVSMAKRRILKPNDVKAIGKKWRDANKPLIRILSALSYARRKGAVGRYTADDVRDIRRAQRDRCAYCRTPLFGKGHIDHIKALANGGTNNRNNIQLTCGPCNHSKKALDPIVFARRKGKLI